MGSPAMAPVRNTIPNSIPKTNLLILGRLIMTL
jgi:hypothetical protein